MLNNNPDLKLISEECGLFGSESADVVVSKIDNLKDKYEKKDLIALYNYMLSHSFNPDIMVYLIRCCDEYRDTSSLEVLTDILLLRNGNYEDEITREKYTNVRVMCAKAIANQKNTDYVSPLLYCLNNKGENYRVRLACADALGRIGDRFAVAPLIDVVKDEDEKSVYVRESAALALGLLGDNRAIDPLVSILEAKRGIMDKFSFLKERIIEALNNMGFSDDERVFKALKHSLSDESPQVRIDALEGIMNSENPQSYDIIKKCLKDDPDEEVKKNALIALYNISDRSILDEVINSSDYSDKLKVTAVEIINEYEGN